MQVLELLGSTGIHWTSNIETFSSLLLSFAKQFSQSSTVHCNVPTNFTLNSSIRSSNRAAPSSSRGMFFSCRSYLIMNFGTAKQHWLNFDGLMSIHFVDKFTTDFGRGLAFATSLPVLMNSLNVLNVNFFWRFCGVFIDPIHNTNQWNCVVFKLGFKSWYQYNDVLREDRFPHSKTGPIFVFKRIHTLGRDVLRFRGCVYSRHAVCTTSDPSSIVMNHGPFPISCRKPASEHSSTISDHQQVLRISVRILAKNLHAPMMLNSLRHLRFDFLKSGSNSVHNSATAS